MPGSQEEARKLDAKKARKIALHLGKIALHLGSFVISILDFVFDWLFYESARTLEQGLVYGRVDPSKVSAILVFSIIGSLLFIAEIVAFIIDSHEIFWGACYKDKDAYKAVLSAFITWFEDIPQVIISVVIIGCREEAISVVQLLKAAVYIGGILISLIVICCDLSMQKNLKCWVRIVKDKNYVGMVALFCLSITVFGLSYTESEGDYEVKIRKPSTFITATVNDQRYFTDVGVFLRDAGLPNTLKGENRSDNWMHLFPIYELKDAKKISIKLTYSYANNDDFNMGIWLQTISADTKSWNLSECYNINQDTAIINAQSSVICLNDVVPGANFDAVYMDFRFQFPESHPVIKKLVFGEIYFNWKISTNGSCMSWDSFISSVIGHRPDVPFLSYFRVNNSSSVYINKYFYSLDGNGTRYFSSALEDIESVDEIWKTSWDSCPSTGSMSPVFDTQMNVECN